MYEAKQAGRNQVGERAEADEMLPDRAWLQRQLEEALPAPTLDLTQQSATDAPSPHR